jgi:hypothetical protein
MSHALPAQAHRARVLRALGVTPWRRRERPAPALAAVPEAASPAAAPSPECVVLLPAGCTARELDLLGRAFCAFGPGLARAARIEVGNGPATVPHARAYLALGEPQAHALGRDLPAEVMHRAHIVLADTPADVLAGAAGKRRLWIALRNLRRALATPGA